MSESKHDLLRDPTHDELYSGTTKELPDEIQRLQQDDTACTFCGVSYFVFKEVQQLQETAKKYKTTFRDFVRFLERERTISQELKTQVIQLKKEYASLSSTSIDQTSQLSKEAKELRMANSSTQRELASSREEMKKMKIQFEEWRIGSTLTEQKLRNEILHFSSQIEKTRLVSETQAKEFQSLIVKDKARILELEAQLVIQNEALVVSERNIVTERDLFKQQIFSLQEQLDAKKQVAKQLETQLRTVQQELNRVVAFQETEKANFAKMQEEISILKHQIISFEKNKVLLLEERSQLKKDQENHGLHHQKLKQDLQQCQSKLDDNIRQMEKIKQEYAKNLEQLRLEHGQELNQLQKDHTKNMEELKASHQSYLKFLKKETTTFQEGLDHSKVIISSMEKKLFDTERLVSTWKEQAQKNAQEVQHVQLILLQKKTLIESLETKIQQLTHEKEDEEMEFKQEKDVMIRQMDQLESKLKKITKEKETAMNETELMKSKLKEIQQQMDQLVLQQQNKFNNNVKEEEEEEAQHEEIKKLKDLLQRREKEVQLLQQTVHRECLERTSLLEKLRMVGGVNLSNKISPDLVEKTPVIVHTSRREADEDNDEEDDEYDEDEHLADRSRSVPEIPQKASFYEKLRRAGQKKSKPRRT